MEDPSGWKTAILGELARLNGEPHERKKKDTILALMDAKMRGESEEDVWRRPDTCARSTWHERWKVDPLLADVLENAKRAAYDWRDNLAANTLAAAVELLALESLSSVKTAVQIRDNPEAAPRDRVAAAFGILDRGSKLTAPKSSVEHDLGRDMQSMLDKVYGDDGAEDDDDIG